MSELKLGSYAERSYGQIARGWVEYGRRSVEVRVRTPAKKAPRSGLTYVLVPGWSERRGCFSDVACVATQLGHTAVTFAYSNNWSMFGVLAKNADDTAAILDAMPEEDAIALLGHSEGGSIALRGVRKAHRRVRSITGVASAEHLLERRSLGQTAQRIREAAHEPIVPSGGLWETLGEIAATARYMGGRPVATSAEAVALLRGNVHEDMRAVQNSSNPPDLRIWLGDDDHLFPLEPMRRSVTDLYGADNVFVYQGGHRTLINDRGVLGDTILRVDAERFGLDCPAVMDDAFNLVA